MDRSLGRSSQSSSSAAPDRPAARRAAVWLRRDLRLHDNPALAAAARAGELVVVFCLDRRLLGGRFACERRNGFLFACLAELAAGLERLGSRLLLWEGPPELELPKLFARLRIEEVHAGEELSPFGRRRDQAVAQQLAQARIGFRLHPANYAVDRPQELRGEAGGYRVFTPFLRSWLAAPRRAVLGAPPTLPPPPAKLPPSLPLPQTAALAWAGERAARQRMDRFLDGQLADYPLLRELPAAEGTSKLSPHLRFGCLSARELEAEICRREPGSELRRQLAWRDFFAALLYHHPECLAVELQPRWREHPPYGSDEAAFSAWREGRTGFPLIDAAMRQLSREGTMPNRLRMVCASFLCKQLGVDWRLGERHFMRNLLDGDVASNNGNWQWAAAVGADPQPAFRRLFNPVAQQRRYDPDGRYTRRHLPQLAGLPDRLLPTPWLLDEEQQRRYGVKLGRDYPLPIVELARARAEALARYRR